MDHSGPEPFSIRTLAAGIHLESLDDLHTVEEAVGFLAAARRDFEEAGYLVQSTRIVTQPLRALCESQGPSAALDKLRRLDRYVADRDQLISIGPLLEDDVLDSDLPAWAADLAAATDETYFSIAVADLDSRVLSRSLRTAARTIQAISRVGVNGEANFRFGAAASVPAGTPFFPVAFHAGAPAFSIGLESAGLVREACRNTPDLDTASAALRSTLDTRLAPLQSLAERIELAATRRFVGIDLSPAPSVDVSIAESIEALSGQPFGAASTLAACAAITHALHSTRLKSCGYSGLMLPLLEDRLLARRAAEKRFGVQDLLFYSSVCGTGLDVVPLPGECSEDDLAGLILDMAVLATRLAKPLSARLLPIPGKRAGDEVSFANPHLTDAVVLPVR